MIDRDHIANAAVRDACGAFEVVERSRQPRRCRPRPPGTSRRGPACCSCSKAGSPPGSTAHSHGSSGRDDLVAPLCGLLTHGSRACCSRRVRVGGSAFSGRRRALEWPRHGASKGPGPEGLRRERDTHDGWDREDAGDTKPADSQSSGDAADRRGKADRGEVSDDARPIPVGYRSWATVIPIPPRVAHIAALRRVAAISIHSLPAIMNPGGASTPSKTLTTTSRCAPNRSARTPMIGMNTSIPTDWTEITTPRSQSAVPSCSSMKIGKVGEPDLVATHRQHAQAEERDQGDQTRGSRGVWIRCTVRGGGLSRGQRG